MMDFLPLLKARNFEHILSFESTFRNKLLSDELLFSICVDIQLSYLPKVRQIISGSETFNLNKISRIHSHF